MRPWNHHIAIGPVLRRLHLPGKREEATLTRSNPFLDSRNPLGVIRDDV